MTLTEINALVLNDVFVEVLLRIAAVPFEIGEDDNISLYDNLDMTPKIPFADLEAEFIIYKQFLLDQENERLRKVDLTDRWNAMEHRDVAIRTIMDTPNTAAWFRDLLLNVDHAFAENEIVEIEAIHPAIKVNKDLDIVINQEIADGAKEYEITNNIRNLVKGHNKKSNLTKPQKAAFRVAFKDIIDYIDEGDALEAKPLIEAIVGQDDLKNKILKVYSRAGL